MKTEELPFTFACRGETLLGILHRPAESIRLGVLIVVGGPQYRTGSHRQFVLLARKLAEAGIPVMRFDYRGMGDSTGTCIGFEGVDEDIAAAVDAFHERCPSLRGVILWGLCDGASAVLFFAHRDPRIRGIVLLNPWTRTVESNAKTLLKHYYKARLVDREFWRKLLRGKVSAMASVRSFLGMIRDAIGRSGAPSRGGNAPASPVADSNSLPERLARGFRKFRGRVLLIMCGNDFTAREFDEIVRSSPAWRSLLDDPRVVRRDLPEADHTFARAAWRAEVARWTQAFVADIAERGIS